MAVSLLNTGLLTLVMAAGVALALGVGSLRLVAGAITLPELLVMLFLAGECFRPFAELDTFWHHGYMGVTAAPDIFASLRLCVAAARNRIRYV